MRPYGFSTGALAYGDFQAALDLLKGVKTDAIELSALRVNELEPLIAFVARTDLSRFSFISVHAPTGFTAAGEPAIVEGLKVFAEKQWPIVIHPNAIHRLRTWEMLGEFLLIENMDKRKPIGRTADELTSIFRDLPKAGLCFDIAHARQYDTSMTEAYRILTEHGRRLRQVHISDVNTSSKHDRISPASVSAYQEVAGLIGPDVPAILETPAQGSQLEEQLILAASALDSREPSIQSAARNRFPAVQRPQRS